MSDSDYEKLIETETELKGALSSVVFLTDLVDRVKTELRAGNPPGIAVDRAVKLIDDVILASIAARDTAESKLAEFASRRRR